MDDQVKQKPKRQAQVRLEVLDENTVRKLSRDTGIGPRARNRLAITSASAGPLARH